MKRLVSLAFFLAALAGRAWAVEVHDDLERDFPLRSVGELHITNLRGGVVLQGWSQDRIRVRAKRGATADSESEARKLFDALDVRFRQVGKDYELAAEYGRGLDIEARLRERKQPRTRMDLVVTAPAHMRLRIWTINGSVSVRSWDAAVDVRTGTGDIQLESIKSSGVNVLCPSCSISVKSARGPVRCMGGAGTIQLSGVEGGPVYVESEGGNQQLKGVHGEQLYVSRSGNIEGAQLEGRIEFHSKAGQVEIKDSEGFLSGRTELGNISAEMKRWRFADKALLESVKGSISLSVPPAFAGELDLWSVLGSVKVDFPVQPAPLDPRVAGPEPLNRVRGTVAGGGEQLRILTQAGNIRLNRR